MNDLPNDRKPETSLDDTVFDEEVAASDEAAPAGGLGSGVGPQSDSVPLAEPTDSPPSAPRPLPPRFREETEPRGLPQGLAQGLDDEVKDETRNGYSAPKPPARPARDRRWQEDLGDTPGLQDSRAPGAISQEDLAEAEVDEIFDRPEQQVVGSTAQYDPEAGRTNVAIKLQAVRQVVRSATSTPFGRLIIALPIALIGLTLTIVAVIIQTMWVSIAAGVVMPLAVWLLYIRYQAWLGHKRYMYRLLESLGEDVSDFDSGRTYRRVGKRMGK